MPFRQLLLWILALSALSIGARNFEQGLSMDAPLYATMARNLARHHEWIALRSDIPEFHPFAEHPHLGFWLVAIVFRLLPAADWSARIPGHLLYVAFLVMFFVAARRFASQRTAIFATVLLWSWYLFSNIFSSVLLDPAVLFFGSASVLVWEAALRKGRRSLALAAGALLALAAMTKGLTIAGFLPAWVLLLATSLRSRRRAWPLAHGALAVLAFLAIGACYFAVVRASSVPDYYDIYWSNQVTHRFARIWSLWGLFDREYWSKILQYTSYLAPLSLLAVWKRRGLRLAIPLSLLAGFVFLFSTNGLKGGQYEVMVLPWFAWLIADGIEAVVALPLARLVPISTIMAVAGAFFVQYGPMQTHAQGPGPEHFEARALVKQYGIETIFQDEPIGEMPFFWTSRLAWYADAVVRGYTHADVPQASSKAIFFQTQPESEANLTARGWCRGERFHYGTFWLPCELPKPETSDWRHRPWG